ncbi:hypothetical protein CANINC_003402 [Pichia inconspicua]|uniref:Uncharacterized protein n=1 Tax=Pichia inconspicua TaxID=52247 RepID=A0A4T0WYV5_9ASCO|nr:hypothetical protein CANINC_003402 [[Candida] inconspicua]
MKASIRLLAHVPSIKFVGGPHKPVFHAPSVHPCAPQGLKPSAVSQSQTIQRSSTFQSRNNLSKRFRYPPLDDIEIDDVLTGGAEILIK